MPASKADSRSSRRRIYASLVWRPDIRPGRVKTAGRRRCRVKGCERWPAALLHEEKKSRRGPQRGKIRGTSRGSKDEQVVNSGGGQSATDSRTEQMAVSTGTNAYNAAGKVALPIVPVKVSVQGGRCEVKTYALLDTG